jgi:hypothetical protein
VTGIIESFLRMTVIWEQYVIMRHYFTKEIKLDEDEAISAIKQWAYPLQHQQDIDPLMKRIGDARIVMLGEATHGTSEYYTWRSYITQRLIQKKDSILLQWKAIGQTVIG